MTSQSNNDRIGSSASEFDLLAPVNDIRVRRARRTELAPLSQVARRTIPGAAVGLAKLAGLCKREPDTVFSFLRGAELIGGVAFLHLNCHGFDALILDEIDLHDPDPRFLASPGERPEAIYLWAISGAGRSALGHIRLRFSQPRYKAVDLYTRPVTAAGERLFAGLGFQPVPSWRPGLWAYQRTVNRAVGLGPAEFLRAA